ncbi:MAG: rod shape-determining protein RodA [Acidobacteria bacterium]|nr:rod shape-determining protein RodA [Acidobacteriota bacterium]MBI3471743.1 rod shape-determining protein RodA [Candidatus Solibacter usitatus]
MSRYLSIRDLDWALLLIALIIASLGVLQVYSATHDSNPRWANAWWKQIVFLAVGLILMWLIASIDYHSLLGQVPLLYAGAVLTLIAVFLIGYRAFGSRRWIPLYGFTFQISEFAKLVLILLVARFLTELKSDTLEGWELLKLAGLVAVPMLLVMKQPDLGTSLTYLPILAVGVFLAGLRWKYVVLVALALLVVLPASWFVLQDYQKARLVSFLEPDRDPRGSGYQMIQSRIAVGAGGMWGKGVTRGSQTQLRFLPVPHTDFIFSAFAEEHGFVGVIVVLTLYFVLLLQIVQNAQTAPDRAGMYVCMGVFAVLLFHVLVNVGMVVGRMPVTGIPLPLMSAGGSNTLSTFLMLGLVNNVRLRRFVN